MLSYANRFLPVLSSKNRFGKLLMDQGWTASARGTRRPKVVAYTVSNKFIQRYHINKERTMPSMLFHESKDKFTLKLELSEEERKRMIDEISMGFILILSILFFGIIFFGLIFIILFLFFAFYICPTILSITFI